MPHKNPRLSIVVSPAVAETLSALSAETGESASSLVRGLLDQAQPALARMLALVRAAKHAQSAITGGVASTLDRVVTELEGTLAHAEAVADSAVQDLVSQAQAVKPRPRAGAGRGRPRTAAGRG